MLPIMSCMLLLYTLFDTICGSRIDYIWSSISCTANLFKQLTQRVEVTTTQNSEK